MGPDSRHGELREPEALMDLEGGLAFGLDPQPCLEDHLGVRDD
jgi:hypothetical protein